MLLPGRRRGPQPWAAKPDADSRIVFHFPCRFALRRMWASQTDPRREEIQELGKKYKLDDSATQRLTEARMRAGAFGIGSTFPEVSCEAPHFGPAFITPRIICLVNLYDPSLQDALSYALLMPLRLDPGEARASHDASRFFLDVQGLCWTAIPPSDRAFGTSHHAILSDPGCPHRRDRGELLASNIGCSGGLA